MGNVLHGVIVARRIRGAEVERPEVDGVVRIAIDHAEGNSQEASLKRLAASQHVYLDGAVAEIVALQPGYACLALR